MHIQSVAPHVTSPEGQVSPQKGKFITFEGIDGAGKTTQAKRLAQWLREQNIDVFETHEPYHSDKTESICQALSMDHDKQQWNPLTRTLLYLALRYEHVIQCIQPALENRRWVICDRFIDSTMAYQGYGQGIDRNFIADLHQYVESKVDLTFILDISPEEGVKRIHRRHDHRDPYKSLGTYFQTHVREGFLTIGQENLQRCVIIDSTPSLDIVSNEIINHVRSRFALT